MLLQRRAFSQRLLALLGTFVPFANTLAATSSGVLLARNAPRGLNPAGYLVSEKLDGVRALWDGSTLRFRSGRAIAAPAWFTAKLPAMALDGELWLGRGQFDALSGTVRRAQPADAEWQQVKYMVFELPKADGSFSQRTAQSQALVKSASFAPLPAAELF